MQDKAILTLGSRGLSAGWSFGLACVLSVACAGGDTPPRTDLAEENIAVAYAGRQPTAQAGSTGMGTGGSSSGTGGSTSDVPAAGAGGSDSGTGGTASGGSAGSGDVSEGGSSGTGPTAGGCDGFAVLQARCNGGSCHGAGTGFSDFASSEAAAEGYAGEPSAICGSQDNSPIFDPDNPGASLVLKKIAGTAACGGPMPLGSAANSLPADDVACLEEWIGTL